MKKGCLVSIVVVLAIIVVILAAALGKGDVKKQESLSQEPTSSGVEGLSDDNSKLDIPEGGIVLFDNDGIVITAQKLNREKHGLITGLDLLIENKSDADKNVCVWPDAALGGPIVVNGYSMKSMFNELVASGKMSKATLEFDSDTIELLEFDSLVELIAPFGTYESRDDYMKHEITTYVPSITSFAEYSPATIPVGELVYNENGIELYKCGFKKSSFSHDSAVFVVKNALGEDRALSFSGVSINGFMSNSLLDESVNVFNGTYSVVLLPLMYDEGDKYTEENVKEIEFTLKSKGFNDIISMDTESIGVVSVLY